VLLGDIVEFRQGPVRDALAAASRVLATLASALPGGATIVLVPGNHDHHLLDGWWARRAATAPPPPLALEMDVDWAPGEPLSELAAVLGSSGAHVSARYPGVWLREDVYATHGHYLDRHTSVPMFERLGAGVMARLVRAPLSAARTPDDYEAVLAPLYAWIHAVEQTGGPSVGGRSHGATSEDVWLALSRRGSGLGGVLRQSATAAGLFAAVTALNWAGLGPLSFDLSGPALRRAGLRAFGETLRALGVDAGYAIFGHSHRAGPLPADDTSEWIAPTGARMLNTGCWVHDPSFAGPDPSQSPYRPGFCIRLEEAGLPVLENLLSGPTRA
jgi:hypothetical protein